MSDFQTLADFVTLNDRNLSAVDGITDLLQEAPFLATIAAGTASNGTNHSYLKETTAPTVGFRNVNEGRAHSKSGDTMVSAKLEILDASYKVDADMADEYKHGRESFINRESTRHLREAFAKAERQIFYGKGTGGDAGGFRGLGDEYSIAAHPAVTAMDGGGDDLSSVWMIRSTGDERDAMIIAGNEGNIHVGDTMLQDVEDEANPGTYLPMYYTRISGWYGLQFGSIWSAHRLANIATGENGDKLTDDLIFNTLKWFPSNRQPTYLVMHRYTREDLRASRTATNGLGTPAPMPTEVGGIPIITTDNISVDETAIV